MKLNLNSLLIGVCIGIGYLGSNLGTDYLGAIAQTSPANPANPLPDQNFIGRWQVKFPTADPNPDIEVAITSDGRIFYVDKKKNEAIEILTLLQKVSDQTTIPDNIKIIDIQAQAKLEAIARQARRIQTEAQTVLSTIHQAQAGYFAKNSQFGSKLEDLGFGTEINSEVFNYKIAAIDSKFIVQTLATLKNPDQDQTAFISISYLTQLTTGEPTIASLVCQGKQKPEQISPRARFIKVGNFVQDIKCPIGYTAISK